MKNSRELRKKIEDICGDIYEVGHAHGSNVTREVPRKVNEGWYEHFEKIMRLIKNAK